MPKKLPPIGTAGRPIRASSADLLVSCPLTWAARHMDAEYIDDAGAAAHTGTAVGRAIELFHDSPDRSDLAALWNDLMEQVAVESYTATRPFLQADLDQVRKVLWAYMTDERNQKAIVAGQEMYVQVELPPHPIDPTGLPILVTGHLDQLRWKGFSWVLWDVKNGKSYANNMMLHYAIQQSLYLLGLNADLSKVPPHPDGSPTKPVQPGGLIRTQDYFMKTPGPVFRWFEWMSLQTAVNVLRDLRLRVAEVRSGYISAKLGWACGFCPLQNPETCLTEIDRLGFE